MRVAPKYALYPSPPKRPRYIYIRKMDNSKFSVPFYAMVATNALKSSDLSVKSPLAKSRPAKHQAKGRDIGDNLARDPGNLLHIVGSCRLGGDGNPLIRVVLESASHSSDLHDKRNRSASNGFGCSTSDDGGRHLENGLKDAFIKRFLL